MTTSFSWRLATDYPQSNISATGIGTFARLVERKTDGYVKVAPLYGGQCGFSGAGLVSAIQCGHLSGADAFAGALEPIDPVFALSSLPFVVRSVDDATRLADMARPFYDAALRQVGLMALYITIWPPTGLWSKYPIVDESTLSTLSIRTYDVNSAAFLRQLGARAEYMSFQDALLCLKDGSIDAVLSSGDGGAGEQLGHELRYFSAINYSNPLSIAVVSSREYATLPGKFQEAVSTVAACTEQRQRLLLRTRLEENYNRMRANGVRILERVPDSVSELFNRSSEMTVSKWEARASARTRLLLNKFRCGGA